MQIRYSLLAPGSRRNNPFFIVRGRTPDGREFEVSTRSADEEVARRIASGIYAKLCEQRPAPAQAISWTFGDACDAYIRWRAPSSSDLARIARLRRALADLPVSGIGQDDLVRAAQAHPKVVSGATLNREYVRPFAAILHYARDAGARSDIRVRAFKERAPDVRVAKGSDVKHLIENAATHSQKLLLQWCWAVGSRISDTLRVTWDDIELGTTLTFRRL